MKRLTWLFAAAAALSACGGGGGDSSSPTPPPPPPPPPTPVVVLPQGVIDTSCGGGNGRVVYQPSAILPAGAVGDRARYAQPLADGSIQLFGVVDNPTGTDDIQDSWWAISRVDSGCAVNHAFGNNGLQYYAMSNPSYQTEDMQAVVSDTTGASTVFGTSVQTTPTQAFPKARTYQGFNADGTKTGFSGYYFVQRPGSQYSDDIQTPGWVSALPNGQWLVLSSGSGPYQTSTIRRINADGSIDASFGNAGELLFSTGLAGNLFETFTTAHLSSMAQDANGKILVAGTFINSAVRYSPGVMRLNADGSLDTSFGAAGFAAPTSFNTVTDDSVKMRVLSSGKILVASIASLPVGYEGVGVWQFLPNGQLDLSYGTGGFFGLDLGTGVLPAACNTNNPHQGLRFITDSDDTVYAGATLYCLNADKTALGSDKHVAVTRISPAGIVDSTFGTNGIFSAAALSQGNIEGLNSLSLTPDHKLLMFATSSADINSANNWVLYRVK